MQAQTRRVSFGKRFAKAGGIAALALVLGFGFVADEAAAWGGSGRGLAVGTGRSPAQPATVHQRQATATPRHGGGGGTLATRR
jgi:hypothetical protein